MKLPDDKCSLLVPPQPGQLSDVVRVGNWISFLSDSQWLLFQKQVH